MDKQKIAELSERIQISGKRHGVQDKDLQDLQQDLLFKYFKNGKGQTIDQAVIDWLRANYGDKRSISFDAKRSINNPLQLSEITGSVEYDGRDRADLYRQLANLGTSSYSRAIFVLSRVCGYSEDEISYFTTTTKERIRSRIKAVESCLYENAKEASRDKEKKSRVVEKILPEKTTREWW